MYYITTTTMCDGVLHCLLFLMFFWCPYMAINVNVQSNGGILRTVASRGGYQMARGRHYAKLSLSNAARLSFSDLCILLFMFLSLCRLCVCVFLCSHWSLVDVPLIFFCPADHVPDWQPRVLLGMVEARSVNVKKTTQQQQLLTQCYLHRGTCLNAMKRFCICSL